VKKAGIYFIFPRLVRHSDLKFSCSNLTVDKQFFFAKNTYFRRVFVS
jgi:hypothetical protein